MTNVEMTTEVKVLINDTSVTDEAISVYLALATNKVLERVYPFRDVTKVDREGNPLYPLPTRYEHLVCELASRYIFRRGFEGQTVSVENGVHRTYETPNDEDLLKEIIQIAGVM